MSQRPRDLDPGSSPAALFGAELCQRRTRACLSQAALGHAVFVSGDLIAKVEKAERRPLPDLVVRLDGTLAADGDLVRLATDMSTARRVTGADGGNPGVDRQTLGADNLSTALLDVLAGIRHLDHGLGSGRALPALLAHARIADAMLTGLRGESDAGSSRPSPRSISLSAGSSSTVTICGPRSRSSPWLAAMRKRAEAMRSWPTSSAPATVSP